MHDTLRSTMRKVYLRLLPFAILSYVLAYIDRINVSFGGLTMRGDLGMSAGTFGLAVRHVLCRRYERPDRQLRGWTFLWARFARPDRCNCLPAVSALSNRMPSSAVGARG